MPKSQENVTQPSQTPTQPNPYSPPRASLSARASKDEGSRSWMQFGLAVVLVAFAVATRPQLQFGSPLWNFSPMVAVALFAGAFFRKAWAFVIPLAAMIISDIVIEIAFRLGYTETWGFHAGMAYIYPAFALLVCLGMALRSPYTKLSAKGTAGTLGFFGLALGTGVVGSVLFFLITNFGSWVEYSLRFGTYEMSFAGLMECYAAGLAFYRQQVTWLGDLIYTALLFGSYLIAAEYIPSFGGRGKLVPQRVEKNR